MKVQSYHEDSSSDGGSESGRGLSLSLRSRSSYHRPVSYREESTDGSDDPMDDEHSNTAESLEAPIHSTRPLPATSRNHNPSLTRRRRPVNTRSQAKRSSKPRERRGDLGRPLHKRKRVDTVDADIVPSGPIPPWPNLPYHVLFDIFHYASYPLLDEERGTRNHSVQWLVNVALLCRAFHEPALAALYYSPPLLPPNKAHGLLNLLSRAQESLSTNYNSKIKELHVDVEALLFLKSGPTLGYFSLPRLIERTPLVKTLRLYHRDDYVVGVPEWADVRSRWSYPDAVFSSANSSLTRLRNWEWNSRFMHTNKPLSLMSKMHTGPAFQHLQELRLLHIGAEGEHEASRPNHVIMEEGKGEISQLSEQGASFARFLNELPELSRLEFFECPALDDSLLPHIPSMLTHLTITNCDGVTSDNIGPFLASHGRHLRELTLNHNRCLNLSFTAGLAESCSNLEKFKMDFAIHDVSSYRDVEPCFEELLSLSEVPTWPASLQDLELANLRKWDGTAAEVFFTSLIDAAPQLRDLRRLVINAILMIGWRDRASFREKWIRNMESVFLRRSKPPTAGQRTMPRTPPQAEQSAPFGDAAGSDATIFDGDLSSLFKRKSARIAQRKLSETEDNDDSSPRSTRTPNEDAERPLFVQGMCDVVQVRIDNQRPSDTQFNENDFLDDELSGDEDWDG